MKKIIFLIGKKEYCFTSAGRLCLLLLSVALSLGIAEITVRKAVGFPLQKEYLRFYCYNYKEIPLDRRDQDLFWKPAEEFKGVKYPKHKPRDVFRIICMGDSVTQGHTFNGIIFPREQTYVYKLEKLLNEKNKGRKKIEIINAGSGGYSSLQGLRYLKGKLWEYEPDMVISWFGINDHYYALFYEDKQQKIPAAENAGGNGLLGMSRLYLFAKNYFYIKEAMSHPIVRVTPDDYYKNCEEMLLFAKEKKIKIIFVVPFEVDRENNSIRCLSDYREKLKALSAVYGCRLIEAGSILEGHDLKNLFMDLCHPNAAGNEIIARFICEQLDEQPI